MQLVSVGAGSAAEGGGGEEDQDHEERGGGGLAGRKCCTCLQYTQNISETPFETSKRTTIYFKQFMYLCTIGTYLVFDMSRIIMYSVHVLWSVII